MLGFDIIIDDHAKPWLLEVNHMTDLAPARRPPPPAARRWQAGRQNTAEYERVRSNTAEYGRLRPNTAKYRTFPGKTCFFFEKKKGPGGKPSEHSPEFFRTETQIYAFIGYGYIWVDILGVAMFAASPSSIMEAAFGRLHNSGAAAFGGRPTVVESIMLDGEAANIAIPKIYTQIYPYPYTPYPIPNTQFI